MGKSGIKGKGKIGKGSAYHSEAQPCTVSPKQCKGEKQAAHYYQRGMRAMEDGQINHAIALFEKATKIDPHLVEALVKTGYCFEKP